jgi:hypothetical protein
LNQFRQYWQSNIAPSVGRDLMHMLSGRHLGGGIAYVSAVCSASGYAVSAGVAQGGSSNLFPYPIANTGNANNWDLIVFTHETGHNLGTGHTHSYFYNSNGTYIDTCAFNCERPLNYDPTIMSYCHLCDGGTANIHMKFHPYTKGRIYNHLRSLGCAWEQAQEGLLAVNDLASTIPGLPVRIDVLRNDRGFVCDNDNVTIDSSSLGPQTDFLSASVEIIEYPLDSDEPREYVSYSFESCGANVVDKFSYEILSTNSDAPADLNSNATVRVVLVSPQEHPDTAVFEASGIDSYAGFGSPLNENATFPPVPAGARVLALGWTAAEFDPTSGTQPDAAFAVSLEDASGVLQLIEAKPYEGILAVPGVELCGSIVLDDEPGEFWYTPQNGVVGIQFYEQSDDTLGSDGFWKSGSTVYLLLEEILVSEGACCVTGDLCTQVASESECEDLLGVFQGSGTVCTPGICVFAPPAVFGACCVDQDGIEVCTQSTFSSCELLGGVYLGDDVPCVPQSCNDNATISAACCVPLLGNSVLCTIATEEECELVGGQFQGEEVIDCNDVLCDQIDFDGACCTASGNCVFVPQSLCDSTGGTFVGAGVECADVECEVLIGACCNGSFCQELIEEDCAEFEGIFRGPGTSCDGLDCELLLEGACCSGTLCFNTTALVCQLNNGEFQGPDTVCSSSTCSGFAVGSCCISEGSCAVISLDDCQSIGGTFRGEGTDCTDATVCLTGACCFGEVCLLGTDSACETFSGEFRGYGIACQDANCEGCPPDINEDGEVDVNDLLVLLEQFGAAGGQADVNGDGVVDVNDVLILIAAWGGDGC